MPDPILISKAMIVAGLLSAAMVACYRLVAWRTISTNLPMTWSFNRLVGGLAVATGLIGGIWMLGLIPAWPPAVDRGRLIWILIPVFLVIELILCRRRDARSQAGRWLRCLLRFLAAFSIMPVVVWRSIYVANVGGPDSRIWSNWQMVAWFSLIGLGSFGLWAIAIVLVRKLPLGLLTWIMAFVYLCSGVTIMLSGYLSAGQLAFPLAVSLITMLIATGQSNKREVLEGAVGISTLLLVGLFVAGHFFAELRAIDAIILGVSLLLPGVIKLPIIAKRRLWLQVVLAVLISCTPPLFVVYQTQHRFSERSNPAATPTNNSPSISDYLNYGNE